MIGSIFFERIEAEWRGNILEIGNRTFRSYLVSAWMITGYEIN